MQNQYNFGVAYEKTWQVECSAEFSTKFCSTVVEEGMKPLVLMYHEARSIFLGSTNPLSLVYFWVFQKYAASDPLSHTNGSPLYWDEILWCPLFAIVFRSIGFLIVFSILNMGR